MGAALSVALMEEDAFANTAVTVPTKSGLDLQFIIELERKYLRGYGVPVTLRWHLVCSKVD